MILGYKVRASKADNPTVPVTSAQNYDTTETFRKKKCPWMSFDRATTENVENFYLGQYTTVQSMNLSTKGETVVQQNTIS